ncbi:hypothetical protein CC2G_008235 [Coprinopsis cinerea AmutBmut pab1-1]|nr:hypothetical protein CC2G_008235 [Coprinopsis cinerea AmutBmut pab1-1]
MTAIEYNFQQEHMSLNLDSRKNVFFVSTTLRDLFMAEKWGLLPEKAILDRYCDSYGFPFARGWVPEFKDKLYKYTIVPLTPPEDQFPIPVIHRYPNPDSESSGGTPTAYPFPFKEFPTITSHIHPNFALFSLGRIIRKLYWNTKFVNLFDEYPIFLQIATIYRLWIMLPDDAFEREDFHYRSRRALLEEFEAESDASCIASVKPPLKDAEADEGQLSDAGTEPRRVYHPPPPKRKRPTEPTQHQSSNKKREEDNYWHGASIARWDYAVQQSMPEGRVGCSSFESC